MIKSKIHIYLLFVCYSAIANFKPIAIHFFEQKKID